MRRLWCLVMFLGACSSTEVVLVEECEPSCELGARQCAGEVVEACELVDECVVWTQTLDCSLVGQSCSEDGPEIACREPDAPLPDPDPTPGPACGETQPTLCSDGSSCPRGEDCASGRCEGGVCLPALCEAEWRVVSGACEACLAGTTHEPGGDPAGPDTFCQALLCGLGEHVVDHACVVCAPGSERAAGDDASGADTTCASLVCAANERVVDHACVACPVGSIRPAGDQAVGPDTRCIERCDVTNDMGCAAQGQIPRQGVQEGWFNDIVLDARGWPHFSHHGVDGDGDKRLFYTAWDGGTWVTQPVDGVEGDIRDTSITLDANERPHIAFHDDGAGKLRYARWDGRTWQVEPVDVQGDVGVSVELVLDGQDRPHIVYIEKDTTEVRYAHHDGISWSIESVHGPGVIAGGHPAIALDGQGRPVVVSRAANVARWSRREAAGWRHEDISQDHAGSMFELRIDTMGRSHVAYWRVELAYSAAMYALGDGGRWSRSALDSDSDRQFGANPQLVLDAQERPHVVYHTNGNGVHDTLEHMYYDGNTWQARTALGSRSSVGTFSNYRHSLAIDAAGSFHLVYYGAFGLTYALYDWASL